MHLTATKAPSEEMSLTNRAFINSREYADVLRYSTLHTGVASYVFRVDPSDKVPPGKIGFGLTQRKWANISLDQTLSLDPCKISPDTYLSLAHFTVEMYGKKPGPRDPINSDILSQRFSVHMGDLPLTVGQPLLFRFDQLLLSVVVKSLSAISLKEGDKKCQFGLLTGNTIITWERAPECTLLFIGKAMHGDGGGIGGGMSIINPNWDFAQMGIGGLDKEFSEIFRRTFASRMFPPEVSQQLGMKHVRGILLYGPPGTGKTLMARQIGKMLNAREPKIVNGPSILDKYVGESEANIRKLFADAEEEEKRLGPHSALHIIIFDEIDAICKTRGSVVSGAGVHDTVVNQLLTKLDGVDQLNNILVIGMTNRRDMIDEALLRPGRLEARKNTKKPLLINCMQLEISLPDEEGRLQILKIHTAKMAASKKLSTDVNLKELAARTKNFSGAEIEGLCRAAAFTAMYQFVKPSGKEKIDPDAFEKLLVKRSDFMYALENDIKPMFGTAEEELAYYAPRGLMNWGEPVTRALAMGELAVRAAGGGGGGVGGGASSAPETHRPVTLLLEGAPKAGKTALAVEIARRSGFPFVKIVTSHKMIGYTETAKCMAIKKIFDDAAKSPMSVVIVDNIEGLIEYNPVGPRFSNYMVQALKDLVSQPLPSGRKMLVLATTSMREAMEEQQLTRAFAWHLHVGMMSTPEHILSALEEDQRFAPQECRAIEQNLIHRKQTDPSFNLCVGIKHLIDLLDLVTQMEPDHRVSAFLSKLEDDNLV
ncbi:Vesicle-fusing ATPase 1 [Taenia solium]